MRLKSLELQGFKSFPDITRLDFEDGFTAVVGPNGSGKSNISDAIRWALGEQSTKNLRGQKMEDVIFLGTQNRKSQGFAKVSLTFDNEDRTLDIDSDEVIISRKCYRSGESEYLLNGENVLLKDISEILMDTGLSKEGYALVGQGKIDEIVSAKSSERRQIFEEAAGITKYRYRKKEAQNKLSLAEENLVRLTDILDELRNRVKPLKIQSEKAKKFRELDICKKQLEISIWINDLKKLKDSLKNQEDKLFITKNDYENEEKYLEELSIKTQEIYDKIQNYQLETERARSEKEELAERNTLKETNIAVLNSDINHAKSDIQRIENEKETLSLSGEDLFREIKKKQENLKELEHQLEEKNKEIEDARDDLFKFNQEGSGVDLVCSDLASSINSFILEKSTATVNISSFSVRISELNERKESICDNINKKKADKCKTQKDLDETNLLIEEIDQKIEELNNFKAGYEIKLNSRKKKLDEINSSLNIIKNSVSKAQQRIDILNDLEKNLEGYYYSVKQVLKLSKSGYLEGVCGTISQLIELPSEYAIAIETALGGGMQNIVVDDETSAQKAIRFLKEQNAGRATFLPLTSVKSNIIEKQGLKNCNGFIGIASNLVACDDKYNGVIKNMLGRTVVVDDLKSGIQMAKQYGYSFKIVTLDGQVINAGGSITGGSKAKNVGLLSRKNEIDKFIIEMKKLKAEQEELKTKSDEFTGQTDKILAQIKAADSELKVCSEDKIKYLGESKRFADSINNINQILFELEEELNKSDKQIKELIESTEESENKLKNSKKQIDSLKEKLSSLQGDQENLKEKREDLESNIYKLDVKKNEIEAGINHLKAIIDDMNVRANGNSDKLDLLEDQLKEKFKLINDKQKELEDEKTSKEAGINEINLINERIEEFMQKRVETEKNSALIRNAEKDHQESKENLGRELTRLEEQKNILKRDYEKIISDMWEAYNITLSQAEEQAKNFEDYSEAKKELASIKLKIRQLGSINLEAIEEYEEVKERYDFLNNQVKDAKKSKNDLEKIIKSLTSSMKDMFITSFNEINYNFKQIFVKLFDGGKAELSLEDREDVLESGINIEVQPPGKIIKNLSSLSGGEKAFVAIAIYFAIIKVRPSPFCVLDEIEAALDDVNVNKFASYINNIDDDTQFIVITHRRGTMEQANVLYGVTMQEEGVSKLLKLTTSHDSKNMVPA